MINADTENDLEKLHEFYDALVAMGVSKNRANCPEMDNVMNQLSDDFQYCTLNEGCIDRTAYQTLFTERACGLYDKIDYRIHLKPTDQQDDGPTHMSLTWNVTFYPIVGCIEKAAEQHKIYYDEDGLITKFDDETFIEPRNGSDCTQSAPNAAPIPEPLQEAEDEDEDDDNDLDYLYEFYDALVAMGESKNRETCPEMDDVMDLLSDDFQYCTKTDPCINRAEYRAQWTERACGLYESIDYSIQINETDEEDGDPTYVSLTWPVTFFTNDGCTIKAEEHHKLYYNDDGLITKFDDESFIEPTEDCPPSIPDEAITVPDDIPSSTPDCPNNPEGIIEFFEALSSVVDDCYGNIDDLMDLLSDDFMYMDDEQVNRTLNKEEYRQISLQDCHTITRIDIVLSPISCNSVIAAFEFKLDNGCKVKKMEQRIFAFDYEGLITRLDYMPIENGSTICPQPSYGSASEIPAAIKPPNAKDDYVSTTINTAVFIDVLDNDHEDDQSLTVRKYTQGSKGTVERSRFYNQLIYTPDNNFCGSDRFTYSIRDKEGSMDSAYVYVDIVCPVLFTDDIKKQLNQLYDYYDSLVDVYTNNNEENCEKEVNDRMVLLSDDYQYCPFGVACVDRAQYEENLITFCGEFEDVSYSIQLHPNDPSDPSYTSLTIKWTKILHDGCTIKEHEQHEFYYDDQELVIRFIDKPLAEPITDCPSTTSGYGSDFGFDEIIEKYEQDKAMSSKKIPLEMRTQSRKWSSKK